MFIPSFSKKVWGIQDGGGTLPSVGVPAGAPGVPVVAPKLNGIKNFLLLVTAGHKWYAP